MDLCLGTLWAPERHHLRPELLWHPEAAALASLAGTIEDLRPGRGAPLSTATVKRHFENAYAKLGVNDRASAVAQAMRQGFIG